MANTIKVRKARYSMNFCRRDRMIAARLAKIMNMPRPDIRRKLRKTGRTGGRSSFGKDFNPLISAFASWKAIRLSALGTQSRSTELHSRTTSGNSSILMPTPRPFSHCDSMAANFVGWCSAISTACISPVTATLMVATKAQTAAILKDRMKKSFSLFRNRCQAETPIIRKAARA